MRTRNLQDISVQYIKGVGPSRSKLFANLGVKNVEDLLYFFPRRYEDRKKMTPLSELKVGETATVSGRVVEEEGRKTWYTKKQISEVIIQDDTGELTCVWFNQPYVTHYFKVDKKVVLHGKVQSYKDRLQMVAPEYEILGDDEEDESLSIGRIVPIYPLTQGLSQRSLRKITKVSLEQHAPKLKDVLPFSLRDKYKLQNLVKSLINIHFPESLEAQEVALKRISFEEFFLFQVSIILRRLSIVQKQGIAHSIDESLIKEYERSFPFELTSAQKHVICEMANDMRKSSPMHRLLQGDVGAGKTLVALFGCLIAKKNNCQSAFMAPTEILARQHYETVRSLSEYGPLRGVRVALLIGSTKKDQRRKIYEGLKEGRVDLLIGTHSLIQEELDFKNLSFVVVDEQHKFGVRQRALLPEKGINTDVLIMTATPIPRTLCLTLYGDLDVSQLDEMPKERGEITTQSFSQQEAGESYEEVRRLVKEGKQAYIIYPIIEESKKLDLKAAEAMFEDFKNNIFKEFKVGLVHGQKKRKETEEIMEGFKNREIDILVATTIIEVGIDVPDANVMVIEHAERFGLSQLHQLRGRIGRSREDALCILISDPSTEQARARLDAILNTNDGFKIAEQDLLIRGPGEFFGRHQHGLNELRVANPVTQIDILEDAREEAIKLTEEDPNLEAGSNKEIKEVIKKRYPTYLDMAKAG